jgi:polar amino acid transport system substrate-binding protein
MPLPIRSTLPLLALVVALASACTSPSPVAAPSADAAAGAAQARRTLAPTGRLRVAVYRGSPSSMLDGPTPEATRGVGWDLGREMARRLGVPFEPQVFARNAEALAAIRAGTADVIFTNASPERARDMDFSPTFVDVEKSFLVPAGSPLATLADLQRPGVRIGVSQGSSTESELRPDYPRARLLPAPTLQAAAAMLADGRLDAFATNKAILFEMSDGLPGSRVLAGHWGMEHFAAGIPKGRDAGRAFVGAFIAAAVRDGVVARAIERAGLRGTVAAQVAAQVAVAAR